MRVHGHKDGCRHHPDLSHWIRLGMNLKSGNSRASERYYPQTYQVKVQDHYKVLEMPKHPNDIDVL